MTMEEIIYLKKSDGKLYKTEDIFEADYVRLPVDVWKELRNRYSSMKNHIRELKEAQQQADKCHRISEEEYHGYQNALRIIKDRSLQQIEREKADDHGYTLRYADQRVYDRSYPDQKAFLISKTTPVSVHVDLETAHFIILKDLENFYNYVDISRSKIQPLDILRALPQRDDPLWKNDFYVSNSDYGRLIYNLLDDVPHSFIFDVVGIRSNIGQGVYEISYWATDPI